MVKTLSEFWNEVASICYDSSDYGIIAQVRSQFRTNEINKFVNAFIPGTEILKDGKNGTPVAMKGKADDDKGASGNEEIDFPRLAAVRLFRYEGRLDGCYLPQSGSTGKASSERSRRTECIFFRYACI